MTTGTLQAGLPTNAGPYYYRTWSGGDGKTCNTVVIGRWFKYRTIERRTRRHIQLDRKFDVQSRRWVNTRLVVSDFEDVSVTKSVLRFRKVYLPGLPRINAYSCTARKGMNIKGSGAVISLAYCYGQGAWSPVWSANDTITLQGKLASQIRQHEFNLNVALAEGGRSVKMVVNCLSRFVGAILALKKGRVDIALRHLGADPKPQHRSRRPRLPSGGLSRQERAEALRKLNEARFPGDWVGPKGLTSKDVSSLWLEIQYGWKPLLQDVHAAMTAWSALTDKARSKSYKAHHTLKHGTYTYTWDPYYTYSLREIVSREVECLTQERMSAARSLGLRDPELVVWELVPFSFVADWFIPIGNYLEALAFLPKTDSVYRFTTRTKIYGTSKGLSDAAYRGSSGYCTSTIISRVTSNSWDVPRPVFKPLDKALSVGHIENGLALLHQLVT